MQKDKTSKIPDGIFKNYFGDDEIANFKKTKTHAATPVIHTEKPAKDDVKKREPESVCC